MLAIELCDTNIIISSCFLLTAKLFVFFKKLFINWFYLIYSWDNDNDRWFIISFSPNSFLTLQSINTLLANFQNSLILIFDSIQVWNSPNIVFRFDYLIFLKVNFQLFRLFCRRFGQIIILCPFIHSRLLQILLFLYNLILFVLLLSLSFLFLPYIQIFYLFLDFFHTFENSFFGIQIRIFLKLFDTFLNTHIYEFHLRFWVMRRHSRFKVVLWGFVLNLFPFFSFLLFLLFRIWVWLHNNRKFGFWLLWSVSALRDLTHIRVLSLFL